MRTREAARTPAHRLRAALLIGLVVVGARTAAALGGAGPASRTTGASPAAPVSRTPATASRVPVLQIEPPNAGDAAPGGADGEIALRRETRAGLARTDGLLPAGVTAFEDQYSGVSNLSLDLLRALRQATTVAANTGVDIDITSGWRSRAYQEGLFLQAVADYGSADKAAQWVARPGTSAHELGNAVDVAPAAAAAWLSRHGAAYGLCQVYANETWHFELRPTAMRQGCPPLYSDPTQDPRMQ